MRVKRIEFKDFFSHVGAVLTFISFMAIQVRKSDVEDDTWLSQCFGRDYYNCAVIFKEPLNK